MPFVVTSTATPPIAWHCPTCRRTERFACSQRFRANANGKLVDIWLIYRCIRCDQTKNITVVERRPVAKVPRALLDAAIDNDAATARGLARDVGLLKRAGARVAAPDDWRLDPARHATDGSDTILLRFAEPLLVRLDAVVAAALGVSRRRVAELVEVEQPTPTARLDALRLWAGEVELRRSHADRR
jgi:hypothetical protein